MDLGVTTQSGFLAWFSQWGQVVYFFAQIGFWVAIAVAALFAASQYRRFVDYKTGKSEKRHGRPTDEAAALDEFAE